MVESPSPFDGAEDRLLDITSSPFQSLPSSSRRVGSVTVRARQPVESPANGDRSFSSPNSSSVFLNFRKFTRPLARGVRR